jgi:hypothetical protein
MAGGTYLRVCTATTVDANNLPYCTIQQWVQIDPSLLTMETSLTADDYSQLLNGVLMVFAVIFVIAMIKKAIET